MKIIILLVFIGAVFSRTTYTTVTDVWYNYNYDLKQIYSDEWDQYIFRAKVHEGDKMDFEILLSKEDTYAYGFNIIAYEYFYEASKEDIQNLVNANEVTGNRLIFDDTQTDDNYKIYAYQYTAQTGVTQSGYYYLGIFIKYGQTTLFPYSSIYFRLDVFKYKYSNIKDVVYNKDYEFDTSIFSDKKIPYLYQIYLRIDVEEKDSMEVQLETHSSYDPKNAFQVYVCQYKGKPTDSDVYYAAFCGNPLENKSNEWKKFAYPFETDEGIDYLAICIVNTHNDLNYLYMTIYSEKGLAAAIIVLIIILPLLLIGGGAGFFVHRSRRREKI